MKRWDNDCILRGKQIQIWLDYHEHANGKCGSWVAMFEAPDRLYYYLGGIIEDASDLRLHLQLCGLEAAIDLCCANKVSAIIHARKSYEFPLQVIKNCFYKKWAKNGWKFPKTERQVPFKASWQKISMDLSRLPFEQGLRFKISETSETKIAREQAKAFLRR